jgi:hypothetical protein
MEIKILNSIFHKELMPWAFDAKGIKAVNEKVKRLGNNAPVIDTELIQQLQILLADYPELSNWLTKQTPKTAVPLKNHCYAIDFPEYTDAISKFYSKIISLETLRVYNAFIFTIEKYAEKVDIIYHTSLALKNIKALCIDVAKEIKEKNFASAEDEQKSLPHFVLEILRQHLTVLFFDIQELSKAYIDNPTSIEDFYLIDLELPKHFINEISETVINEAVIEKVDQEWISFGFKDDIPKLKIVINQLCTQIELINDDITESDDLINALISRKLIPGSYTIKLNCETKMFRYIIDKLKPYFTDLSLSNIEKSAIFFSKQDIENLSSSKNKSVVEPKEKATIDKIFKHLQ